MVRYTSGGLENGLRWQQYKALLVTGLKVLSAQPEPRAALRKYLPSGTIGLKTNCLVRKLNSTPVPLAEALSTLLVEAGTDESNIIIWERTSRELKSAGYTLNASSFGRRCLGTDAGGVGYSGDFYSSGDVSSLLSRVLTDLVDYNVNLPVLKDHSVAGLSGALKNMYGAIHNPNKYHANNCDPFCAHVNNLDPIRQKNRLAVLDAVKVQYNGGPGYMDQYISYYGGVIISDDPVAADRVGLEIVEQLRSVNGLPRLAEVGRPVKYLKSAQEIGLGVADLKQIELEVIRLDKAGKQIPGRLFDA